MASGCCCTTYLKNPKVSTFFSLYKIHSNHLLVCLFVWIISHLYLLFPYFLTIYIIILKSSPYNDPTTWFICIVPPFIWAFFSSFINIIILYLFENKLNQSRYLHQSDIKVWVAGYEVELIRQIGYQHTNSLNYLLKPHKRHNELNNFNLRSILYFTQIFLMSRYS